jgi:hypothetical protein
MRPITVTVGPGTTPLTSAPVRLDEWADASVGISVVAIGTANYTVQYSFDEGPDSLTNPIPVASMFWDSSMIPAAAVGGIASASFSLPTAPLWIRLVLNSGSGSARMVIVQYQVVNA